MHNGHAKVAAARKFLYRLLGFPLQVGPGCPGGAPFFTCSCKVFLLVLFRHGSKTAFFTEGGAVENGKIVR